MRGRHRWLGTAVLSFISLVSFNLKADGYYVEPLGIGECSPLITTKKYQKKAAGSFAKGKIIYFSCDYHCRAVDGTLKTQTANHQITVYSTEGEGRHSVCAGVKMKSERLPWNGMYIWNIDSTRPFSALYSANDELVEWAVKQGLHQYESTLIELQHLIAPEISKAVQNLQANILPYLTNAKDQEHYQNIVQLLEMTLDNRNQNLLANFLEKYLSRTSPAVEPYDAESMAYFYFLSALKESQARD